MQKQGVFLRIDPYDIQTKMKGLSRNDCSIKMGGFSVVGG